MAFQLFRFSIIFALISTGMGIMNAKKVCLALAVTMSVLVNLALPAVAAKSPLPGVINAPHAIPVAKAVTSPDYQLDPPKDGWPPPVVRSTLFESPYNSQVIYSNEGRFNFGQSMTVEAWVRRDALAGCMTILTNELPGSFWFGVCPQLRFARDGSAAVMTEHSIPNNLWTHVAASYDGAHVSFYMDGYLAGWYALSNMSTFPHTRLRIGFDPQFGVYFGGSLDEIRLWSVARTEQQIRDGMFEEIRAGTGLVAVFANGSSPETLLNSTPELIGYGVDNTSYANGLGILPTGLVVPKAAAVPVMDGNIDEASEFAGAERAIIRYRYANYKQDAVAYFVHTDTDLHVGYYSTSYPFPEPVDSWVGLFLDNNYSREALIQTNDIQVRSFFDLSLPPDLRYGDGAGNWVICPTMFCSNTGWQVVTSSSCHGEFTDRCREYRVAKTRLGEWTQTDGVAFGHIQFDGAGDDRMFPGDAVNNVPVTWTSMTYTEESAILPHVSFSGHVYDGRYLDPRTPREGVEVQLIAGTTTYTTQTLADGSYSFSNLQVPYGEEMRIWVDNCPFCKAYPSYVGSGTIDPVGHDGLTATYPGCFQDICSTYKQMEFFLRSPIGELAIGAQDPAEPFPSLVYRESDNYFQPDPPNVVRIFGTNLHEFIHVDLTPYTIYNDVDMFVKYEADLVNWDPAGNWIDVRLPVLTRETPVVVGGLPAETLNIQWRWLIADEWIRPANGDIWYVSNPFRLATDYPKVWGFGFENEGDNSSLDEFLTVYDENAYICVGVGDLCATRVPDLLYWD
ncbi:MAG: hypothetical protein CVU46_10090, partial [Chloroflexi bacterium HGW-Chloroflexi-8]